MLQLPQGLAFRCPLSPPGPGRVGLHPGKGRPQEPLPLPAASVAWTWPECWDPLGLSGICSQSAPARRRLHQVTEHEEQGTGVPETVPGGARSPPLVSSSVSPASPPSPLLMTDDSTSRAWTRSTVGGGSGCCPAAGGWAARAGGNPHVSVASDPPPTSGQSPPVQDTSTRTEVWFQAGWRSGPHSVSSADTAATLHCGPCTAGALACPRGPPGADRAAARVTVQVSRMVPTPASIRGPGHLPLRLPESV